jgi:hypothetical protein
MAFRVDLHQILDADNHLTKALVDRVDSKRDLLISTTFMGEKTFLQAAVMSARTTNKRHDRPGRLPNH